MSRDKEKVRSYNTQYRQDHREELRAYDAARRANPDRRKQRKSWNLKYNAANREGIRLKAAKYRQSVQGRMDAARLKDCLRYGPWANELRRLLWRSQEGRDYITQEPLIDGFHLDHGHDSDLVRGLVNATTNLLLGQRCGDSVVGCRQRLAKLKNKEGKLGTFIKLAIPALMHTPMMRMGLEYRVTGDHASLPESHTNRHIIERANMLAIDTYMSRQLAA